jgi:hypothetical protein
MARMAPPSQSLIKNYTYVFFIHIRDYRDEPGPSTGIAVSSGISQASAEEK